MCNSPRERDQHIRSLASFLPVGETQIVHLSASCTDPLEEVLHAVKPGVPGPVMILDLEAPVIHGQERAVLQSLNLRRAEWPILLPRPVVLWIPEHLLQILGRNTPDFLDWRTDTLYFLGSPQETLLLDQWSMTNAERAVRIARLRKLLARRQNLTSARSLPAIAALQELGAHLMALDRVDEADEVFRRAWQMQRQPRGVRTPVGFLPSTNRKQGALADLKGNLARVSLARGKIDESFALIDQAIELDFHTTRYDALARHYAIMAEIYLSDGQSLRAEYTAQWALDIDEWLRRLNYGNEWLLRMDLRLLGKIRLMRNRLDAADDAYRRAVEIDFALGREDLVAEDLIQLGIIRWQIGARLLATLIWQEAREIYTRLATTSKAAEISIWLDRINRGLEPMDFSNNDHSATRKRKR